MIEERLLKKNIRFTPKGRKWADNFEAILFYAVILLAFGIVGSIERVDGFNEASITDR